MALVMALEVIRDILMWCSLINAALLIFLFVILTAGRKWVYSIHSKLFPITEEQFNMIIYSFFAFYKIVIIVFNIIPYVAVSIAIK